MPYAPGVVDQSGQILANGVNGMMQQYAQDMLRMQENEQKRRAAAGQIQGLLASDPSLAAKADPALVQKLGAGKATLADTMQLLGTLSAVRSSQDEQLKAKLQDAQIQQALQHGAYYKGELDRVTAQLEAMKRDATATQNAFTGTEGTSDPGALLTTAGRGGASAATLAHLSQAADNLAQAKQRSNPQGQFTYPSIAALEQDKPKSEWDYKVAGMNPQTGAITISNLNPRGPSNQPNPFRDAVEGAVGKQVASVIEKVPEYTNTLEQVQRARAAMEAGATTGGMAGAKLAIKKGINGLFGANVIDTADTELAGKTFSDMALSAAARMKTQGQITEQERKLLADTVAQLGDSPQAVAYVLNYMDAKAQRDLGKAQAIQQLIDSGETKSAPFSRLLATWEKDNPINLQQIGAVPGGKPKGETSPPAPAKGPTPPPGWTIRQ